MITNIVKIKNQRILIKTYCFESGLYYLAESLAKELVKNNNTVIFFPKAKYKKEDKVFKRTYPDAANGIQNLYKINKSLSVEENILQAISLNKIDTVISLETLMEKAGWVEKIKSTVKIIDIPMIEWVTPHIFKSNKYNIFDQVWCLTNKTYDEFLKHKYKNAVFVQWNWVNEDLFFKEQDPNSFLPIGIKFYHQASLNSDFSSKNTEKVVLAFDRLINEKMDAYLYITGSVTNKNILKIIEKNSRIKLSDPVQYLSRIEIANIYKNVDCVIAPSSQEGLGLSLYEAKACGCLIITTDFPPMNEIKTDYLCEIDDLTNMGRLIPWVNISVESIYKQIKRVYEAEYGKENPD